MWRLGLPGRSWAQRMGRWESKAAAHTRLAGHTPGGPVPGCSGALPGEAASGPWDACSSHHCGCSPSRFIPRETHSALSSKTTCLTGKKLTGGNLVFYPLGQEAWILGG